MSSGPDSQTPNVLIDIDEILPEINIRELLTIEQLQEFNTNFVAFTDNDVYILMNELLKSKTSTIDYIKLYKSVLYKDEFSLYKYNVIPKISCIRKNYEESKDSESDSESESESEIKKYFRDYANALTARNYLIQQNLINKISFPFNSLKNESNFTIQEPGEVILNYDNRIDYSRITIADIDHYDDIYIDSLLFKQPKYSYHGYLYDINKNKSSEILIKIEDDQINLKNTVLNKVIPNFDLILKNIKDHLDIRKLSLYLSLNGYDLDELTKEQFNKLQDHMSSIIDSKADTEAEAKPVAKADTESVSEGAHQIKINSEYINFKDILNQHFSKFELITEEQNMITILQNITGFLTNIDPQAIVLEDEISTINILTKLKADSNIDDIINKVHTFFIQKNRTKVMIFMDNYKQLRLPEELDKIIKKYSLIDTEYIDYADNLIIDTVSDLKEIVLGNNTKNYDGSPNKEQQEEIHAEDEEYLLPIDENETEIETNIADVLTSLTALTASEISEIHKFTDGVKDILIKVIPILLKISYISGLPFDTKKICELLSNNILFESRRSQILKELPDIAESLIEIIINQTKYEDAISFIHDIDNVNIVTKLQDIYPRIYKSWDKECNKCIIESLTIWWLDLLESSLRGNLKFNIFDGYIQYASYWNKFGPPLQPKATSGILIYLVNISSEILEEYDSDKSDLRKSIETFANEKYKDKLNELLDLWKEIKDTEIVEDNFEKAKMSLIETIKQLQQKNKPKNYVSSFINAFLYLPEYFPKKSKSIKNASWAQGCCLTKLDENYQSDADWRDFASLTQLLKIKNGLSKNKFIGTRANYYYFSKKPRKESEATEATEAREGGPSKPHLKPSKIVIPEKEKQQEKESKVIFEKIDCTAMNQEDEKDKENVAKNKEFIWLPKSIKNDSSKMKKTTEAMLKSIFTIKNASIMSKIFENIMSISHSISILNIIISSLQKYKTNSFVNGILVYCKEMKDYINILDQDDITLSKYILAKALCYPCNFDISKSKLVLPSGITEDIYPSIKKDHIKHIVEWDKSRTVMNDEEIKEYLNTMREKQKDIILDNLNAIEDNDEKQLLSEMKNFGLISYTDIYKKQNDEEIVVEEHYLDEDLVGESDFAMESTDPDQNNEEDLP